MTSVMYLEVVTLRKILIANFTLIWLITCMDTIMVLQIVPSCKPLATDITGIRPHPNMDTKVMTFQVFFQ
jgi:hypothetical protein